MKQQERQKKSKEKILQAAITEFSASGYDKVTMENICTRHGISKGMMYHYYSGKDDLFLLCVQNMYQMMQQYLEEKPGMFTDVEKLTKKDMEEEFFYVGLRMTAGVSLSEFERRFGMSAEEVYPGLMETFVEEKAAEFRGDRFVLTDYGLDVSNYIMAQFLQD